MSDSKLVPSRNLTKLIPVNLVLFSVLLLASCSTPQQIYLNEIDLSTVGVGWGQARVNQSITENPLRINEVQFEQGIGVHATSTFLLELDGKATEFAAKVGVDDAADTPASVQFFVLGDGDILWESEPMKKGMSAQDCQVNIKGIQKLGLLVTDAGDGISNDHANWCEAQISYRGTTPKPAAKTIEAAVILTPPAPDQPRINGPSITGVRPGAPLLHRIPATGNRPMSFSAHPLPDGIMLDAHTGILSGTAPGRGDYVLTLSASNELGSDDFEFTIRVGDTLALTPHMGWNSWYIHYDRVSDAIMREAADQMIATGMADYGYQYVNIDDCWMVKVDSDDPEIGGPLRDNAGKLLTNKRFPDMYAMTDYIHQKGRMQRPLPIGALIFSNTIGAPIAGLPEDKPGQITSNHTI